jgi:ribosome biogenesis protein BRX1
MKCDARQLPLINEVCEMKDCTTAVIFEARRRGDLYLWLAKTPAGPSIKFLVRNVHTMRELKFTGNCLKGSRPVVCFDENFDSAPHYRLIKEVLKTVFITPNYHPKSKPFIDHSINFYIHDNHIWFRNYQITGEQAEKSTALVEIGPRFVLNPIKILSGSFFGTILWENPKYLSPSYLRGLRKRQTAQKHDHLIRSKRLSKSRKRDLTPVTDPLDHIFEYDEKKVLSKHHEKTSESEDTAATDAPQSEDNIGTDEASDNSELKNNDNGDMDNEDLEGDEKMDEDFNEDED